MRNRDMMLIGIVLAGLSGMPAGGDEGSKDAPAAPARRALAAPFNSPPFPSGEYQGYPLVGVPIDDTEWPLDHALHQTSFGEAFKRNRLRFYGWVNVGANESTSKYSNMPTSYWFVPRSVKLDQTIFRIERQLDSVQTKQIDWGFRSSFLYGTDYRYMTAGGWFSDQLLEHNSLYGWDPTEQYVDVYFPHVTDGFILRVGRWIACPDIETQFAPDNYMGSHSLLFTVDTYTQTGTMGTWMLNKQWTIQAGLHAGTDMAPWYEGATPTGMLGVRWVSLDNKDSHYLVLNAINNAHFQHFQKRDGDGNWVDAGHDNFNYLVETWQHTFSPEVHTKTEGYFMWQKNTVVGGTPSLGPVQTFGGGGGIGADIDGTALNYGMVNYTMFQTSPKGFITIRNEWIHDQDGMRYGFPGTYTSHAIGYTHNFTPLVQVRPELGYYRNWHTPAFDLGNQYDMWMLAVDMTVRF